jgi:hypothetical protein
LRNLHIHDYESQRTRLELFLEVKEKLLDKELQNWGKGTTQKG